MQLFVVLGSLILAINASGDVDVWTEFKVTNARTYRNQIEENHRFAVFQSNLRTIENHNARYENGLESYYLKVTQFADLTDEEFEAFYLNYQKPDINYHTTFVLEEGVEVPDPIDWREKGAVLQVKDQGKCGSCWAFSATGALEGQNAIKHNVTVSLSEQELVECATTNSGCDGGSMIKAFVYVKNHGISTEESYPYTSSKGVVGNCKAGKDSGINVTDYADVRFSEYDLRQAVGTVGPISTGINANGIKLYAGGIYNNPSCSQSVNHGVLVVGYGSQGHLDYWIVKNSWGSSWGESGYIKMSRNRSQQCGIALFNSYPLLA